jgi:anti-sigma factor RsiW
MKNHLMRMAAPMIRRLMGTPSCQEVNSFLMEYVDEKLDAETSERYRKHLGRCGTCTAYLEQYQDTIKLAKECQSCELPSDLVEHTLSFLKEQGVTN